jgi:hypothetical protein
MPDVLVQWIALLCHIQEVPGPETSLFDQGYSSWLSSFSAAGLLSFYVVWAASAEFGLNVDNMKLDAQNKE